MKEKVRISNQTPWSYVIIFVNQIIASR